MTFSTPTFLVFAAIVFAVYWAIRSRRRQNAALLVASYVFYGWWDPWLCLLIVLSSLVDFVIARGLATAQAPRARNRLLAVSIATNLGLLGTFKYFDFFVASAVEAAAGLGLTLHMTPLNLVLPVGISFYTFQTLSTTIDVYRRQLEPPREALAYFTYVAFFPQLVAGPIERGRALLPQFTQPRRFDPDLARDGLRQLLWGLFQKVALADNLATYVDDTYGSEGSPGPMLAVATVCFAFQIYWDFAGYSHMAIGTAKLFGIRLRPNFAYPYFSRSIREFWRRWHISLSTWFRDYVYVPLGGNRAGRQRQVLAVVATFTISGLWHGAAWTFVTWGLLHGLLALPSILGGRAPRAADDTPGTDRPGPLDALRMLATFGLVCLGWIFFRAPTVADAWRIVQRIAADLLDPVAWSTLRAHGDYLRAFLPLVGLVVMVEWIQRRHPHPLVLPRWPRPVRWLLYTALVWSTVYLVPEIPHRFIYFQF